MGCSYWWWHVLLSNKFHKELFEGLEQGAMGNSGGVPSGATEKGETTWTNRQFESPKLWFHKFGHSETTVSVQVCGWTNTERSWQCLYHRLQWLVWMTNTLIRSHSPWCFFWLVLDTLAKNGKDTWRLCEWTWNMRKKIWEGEKIGGFYTFPTR
jgi:hypothetical protein